MSTFDDSLSQARLDRRKVMQIASVGLAAAAIPVATTTGTAAAQTPVPNAFGEPTTTGGALSIALGGIGRPRNFVGTSFYGTDAFFTSKLIYTPLILLDREWGNPGPGLAESWEWNAEGTQMTMKLRAGVTFHDGAPFTANDVIFTFKLCSRADKYFGLRDPKLLKGGADYVAGTTEELPGVVAQDDLTVVFTLESTTNVFELNISNVGILPAHKFPEGTLTSGEVIENLPFFAMDGEYPIGTGPWKIADYNPETFLKLTANDTYFKGRPVLDELTLRYGIAGPALIAGLQAGEFDSGMINGEAAKTLEGSENLTIDSNSLLATETVVITATEKEYMTVPVRQALLSAIDVQALIDTVTFGYAAPAPSITMYPALFPNETLPTYTYDPERAKQLLAEAGWDMGRTLNFAVFTAEGAPTNIQAAVMSMWQQIGLNVQFTPLDPAQQADLTAVDDHPYDVTLTAFAWLAYDPSSPYQSFATEKRPTWSNYSNPAFDTVISEAIRVPTMEEAIPKYQEGQTILQTDLPYAPLWIDFENWAISTKVHGGSLGRGPLNDIESEKWWKEG